MRQSIHVRVAVRAVGSLRRKAVELLLLRKLPPGDLPEIYIGESSAEDIDWREVDDESDEDDDLVVPETPKDVVEILGFDPLEL